MKSTLIPLYGPFSINIFGLVIIIGIGIFSALFLKDSRRPALMSSDTYWHLLSLCVILGLLGARLFFIASNNTQLYSWASFAIWEGGLSLQGGIIALVVIMPFVLKKYAIPIGPTLDLVATYTPLLLSISRIGCFLAGCCAGLPCHHSWSIYNPEGIASHPTQLYSAALLFMIFILMYNLAKGTFRPGQQFCIFLFLISAERMVVDIWRIDQEFIPGIATITLAQITALILAFVAVCGGTLLSLQKRY